MVLVFKKLAYFHDDYHLKNFESECKFSCSQNGEVREFSLFKESYHFHFWFLKLKFRQSIGVKCHNCGWSSKLPYSFAKKAFKNGIKAETLLNYAHNKVITSRPLNFFGDLWQVWIWVVSFLIVLTLLKYYSEPVMMKTPREVSFEDILKVENQGKIVKVRGKVDYALAFTKETIEPGKEAIVRSEVYMPFFAKNGGTEFLVIRGGASDVEKVNARANVTNYELLTDQDYEIIGKLDPLETLKNRDLRSFFTEELPQKRNLNAPKFVINSADIVTLAEFYNQVVPYYYIFLTLLVSSTAVQFYIDKRLTEK